MPEAKPTSGVIEWDRCSHCIMGVKPLGEGWTHIDDDPKCVDFWGSQANALHPEVNRAWWADKAAHATDCVSCNGRIQVGDAVRKDHGFTIHGGCP